MKDERNYKWTMEDIAHQYKEENPDWSWKNCWKKASVVYKELKRLNNETWHNTKVFFNNTTPFSFFDNKDGEFSDKPWDGKSE